MLVGGVLPVPVPDRIVDEESMGSNVGLGGVEVEGAVLDVPVVSVVDIEPAELDGEAELDDISETGAGGSGSGDNTEACTEEVEDAELLFVVEMETVELLLDDVVGIALRVVLIETSLFVTAAALTAELPIVFVGVTTIVVVEVLAGPIYPHHL